MDEECYRIDIEKSLEENIILRDEFYTPERISSMDQKYVNNILKPYILDNVNFEKLYNFKLDINTAKYTIRFMDTTEAWHTAVQNT